MGFNDYDFDLDQAIQDLLDENVLEQKSPAYGIAQQVIHSGYNSLSPKQREIYDLVIIKALKEREKDVENIRIDLSNHE